MAGLGPDGGGRDIVHISLELEAFCAVGGPDGVDDIVEILVGLFYGVAQRSIFVGRDSPADARWRRRPFSRMSSMEISEANRTGVPPRGYYDRGAHIDPAWCGPPSTPGIATG